MSQPLQHKKATVELKRKALEPHERYCRLVEKKVTVLVEYMDYKTPSNKGEQGTLYCGNMLECYHKNVCCRYSGISPLYPDPFEGMPENYAGPQPEEKAEELPVEPDESDANALDEEECELVDEIEVEPEEARR